jgi:hypothetical protein
MISHLNPIITGVRTIARKIHQSPKLAKQVQDKIEAFNSTLGPNEVKISIRTIPMDVPTRWSSTFDMLIAYQKIYKAFNSLPELKIEDNQMDQLDAITLFLERFRTITLQVCKQDSPTYSQTLVHYKELMNLLTDSSAMIMETKFLHYEDRSVTLLMLEEQERIAQLAIASSDHEFHIEEVSLEDEVNDLQIVPPDADPEITAPNTQIASSTLPNENPNANPVTSLGDSAVGLEQQCTTMTEVEFDEVLENEDEGYDLSLARLSDPLLYVATKTIVAILTACF